MGKQKYSLYDLVFQSDIKIFGIMSAPLSSEIDFEIKVADVSESMRRGTKIGPFCSAEQGYYWLEIRNILKIIVHSGREIIIDPSFGVDESTVALFVLSVAIPALLHQRGNLVLCGSALEINGVSVLVCGRPSVAIGSLCARFRMMGKTIVSGEYAVLSHTGSLLPGPPYIKLWENSLQELGLNKSDLRRTRPQLDQFYFDWQQTSLQQYSIPKRIFVIQGSNIEGLETKSIRGFDKFKILNSIIFNRVAFEAMGLKINGLRVLAALVERASISEIRVTERGDYDLLVSLIEEKTK